ncbi:hypothetical protein [Paraburkholderia tropica]|uniref:hypothetical protein n=1 Tax=Paraburkholderia tropica TaxID=92647 RepID=UPI001F329B17|nr:hypothetical protein [Paraburkholderia tropica]
MKNLYARVVLFLIRPAVQRALREESKQGGTLLNNRTIVSSINFSGDERLAARIGTLNAVGRP